MILDGMMSHTAAKCINDWVIVAVFVLQSVTCFCLCKRWVDKRSAKEINGAFWPFLYEQLFLSMGPIPCLKGCGFFGDPEQRNLCSQCYKDEILAPVRASIQDQINQEMAMMNLRAQPLPPLPPIKTKIAKTKRCESCKRKIGLTGFRCKCGGEFCSAHRLPEYCRKMPCSRSNCGFSLQIRSKWVLPHFAFRANSERHRCHRCLSWAYRHEATV